MVIRRPFHLLALLALALTPLACSRPGASSAEPDPTASTAPGAQGCSNPLYPVVNGAQWNYALSGMSSGAFTHSIIAVRPDGFTDQDVFEGGVTRTGEWKCEAGALTALSPAESLSAMIQSDSMSAAFRTTSSSGVTLPAIVTAGTTWSQDFTIEGTQSVSGQEVEAQGEFSYSCTAAAAEPVSVPAGSFDAVRADCQISGTIKVKVAGFEVPTKLTADAKLWYAPNVGMVKTESELSGIGSNIIELTAYTIP
jgi:hypothetical protein